MAPFLLAACASKVATTTEVLPPIAVEEKANLTQADAMLRSSRVKDVRYDLEFTLPERSESYSGVSRIAFELSDASSDLRVDFQRGKIVAAKVNGAPLELARNLNYLWLPKANLILGKNNIELVFEQTFSTSGDGLMRVVDPEDKRVYTYTNLEPYDASRVFPCFDQPDLKATYKMKVHAPKSWVVVTSVRESSVRPSTNKGLREWTFPESAKFSTYIWSLHAGPYHVWKDQAGAVPLRLLSRQSLAKYVNPKDWFTFTKQGFKFFDAYFAFPYPFKKYDQVIVPEFSAGAMENVGAVTFSERFISRGEASKKERRNLANTLLHEMAHMWFGNLVTMRWWNDLWLNESFATYMAALALVNATEFKDEWRYFHGTKEWAYWEDQLVTSHPIEAVVPDTMVSSTIFDGISYGKGASVMQQLAFTIGADSFRDGLRAYFKTHAFSNATLGDFMSSLSQASGRDMKTWQREWLQIKGVNTITADWKCEAGKLSDLSIRQSTNDSTDILRSHSLQVALLQNKGKSVVPGFVTRVDVTGSTTPVKEAIGKPCPTAIYPNYGDHAYVKVELDPKSISLFKQNLASLADPFTRQLIWQDLWNMVVDAKLPFTDFAKLTLSDSTWAERDEVILREMVNRISSSYGDSDLKTYFLFAYGPNDKSFLDFAGEVENRIWKNLEGSAPKSEYQKLWFDSFLRAAATPSGLEKLEGLLDQKVKLTGYVLDQDRRWRMIARLASYARPGIEARIETEAMRDPSKFGQDMAFATKFALPVWEKKVSLVNEFKEKKSKYSLAQLRMATRYAFPTNQAELKKRYGENFFGDLTLVNEMHEGNVLNSFMNLAPFSCERHLGEKITAFMGAAKALQPGAEKDLLVLRQENERCRRVVELSRGR